MNSSSEDYLKYLLCGIVEQPDQVKVERSSDEMGILLSVSVSRNDMGKVIGREGQTAKAIRHILNAHGFSQREKVSVKILEPLPA